jgi:nucleoside 2-deoxyribosyltransferase
MKIYFTSSVNLPQNIKNVFESYFTKKGIKYVTRVQPKDSGSVNFNEAEVLFQTNTKNLKTADLVVADCTYISSDVGFEISSAIQEKKPVIALYNFENDKDHPRHIKSVPVGFKGNSNKYLLLKEYRLQNFEKTLELAIKDSLTLIDTKFILIIPPMIDRYLEWNVREKGLSKAEVTRDAIDKMMAEDKRYQDYLKSSGLAE